VSILRIENEFVSVAVASEYGARVVSLLDKASGREWMTEGGESPATGEDAVYAHEEAVAWDECFPTVGACDASDTPWGRRLRDHGDLWGRPWRVGMAASDRLDMSYLAREFRFNRNLTLDGATLVVDYSVVNLLREPLPYLWALHALLAVRAGDRIEIPGLPSVRPSYLALDGERLAAERLAFPAADGLLPFPLDQVQPPESRFAAKLIASDLPGGKARIGRPGQWLNLSWSGGIANLGIWMTYGAWFGHQELAIEPTSAPADDLGQAIAAKAPPLSPGELRRWQVRWRVGK
jgi:galactose mutarotase-like enzyme